MDKFTWDTTLMNSSSPISVMYRGSGAVGHVDANVGAGGIARAHVWDFEGARWCDLGVFPSVAEAKAAAETLAPLYWRDC